MSLRQWLWLGLLAFLWGSAFVFMEWALVAFSPVTIVTGRMVVAAVVLNGAIWGKGAIGGQGRNGGKGRGWPRPLYREWSRKWQLWVQCALLSLLSNLLPFCLISWGQQHISASLAAILIASTPIFTVALAPLLTGEALTLVRAVGVLVGFGGVAVLIGPQVLQDFSLRGLGEVAVLAAALSYSLSGFLGLRFKAVPAPLLSTMTLTTGAVLMLSIALGVAGSGEWPLVLSWQWPAALAILALGVLPTAIAYLIYFRLLAEAGVVNTSLVSFLVPLSAMLLGHLFLQERLEIAAYLGMVLILGGLAIIDGRAVAKLRRWLAILKER